MKWSVRSVFVAFVLFLRAQQSDAENVASPNLENSGVSVAFCDDFETNGKESFKIAGEIAAKTLEPVNGRFSFRTRIDPSRGMQRYDLPVLIPQRGVKHIKVFSSASGEDICLKAVSVDTSIFVDSPTNFQANCSAEEKTSSPPCKEFESKLKPLKSDAEKVSKSQKSGVSLAICDDFQATRNASLEIISKTLEPVDGTPLFSAKIGPSGGVQRYDLPVLIPQKGVKYIKVVSTSGEDLCLQAVAVDTNIFVDLPTNFKTTCSDKEKTSFPPCKEFESELRPLKVCPNKISELLERKQLIDSTPAADPEARPYEVPTYSAINDYAQAGYAIVERITDLSRKGVKGYMNQLESAKQSSKLLRAGTLTKISSILGAVGPALGIFGGLTSILTTVLTPNPFDKLAEYLQEEFTALHNHLDRMEGELKELIMAEGAMTRMADAVASIRYSLREFDDIAKSLKKNPVCGTDNLIREYSVDRFVRNYNQRDTEHKLLDLLEVELGLLPLTQSLLKPFMKTYCKTKPGKVKRFMTDISTYAFLGTQAQLFFNDLICTMYKLRNCDSKTSMWRDYLKKLLSKANALYTVALERPTEGFYQFFKDDLRREVSREVEGESNTEDAKLKRVADLFIYFLTDPENWPKSCIVDSGKKVVAFVAVKTNASVDHEKKVFFSPYYLKKEKLKLVKMKITNIPQQEHVTSNIDMPYCFEDTEKFKICKVSKKKINDDNPILNTQPNGKLIYMEINPQNKYLKFSIKPFDVFKSPDIHEPLLLGCWDGDNFLANDDGNYSCPTKRPKTPYHPNPSRFCLFYKNEPNYPKDEPEEG